MRAFLVGILFLLVVAVLAGIGVLLFPFLLLLGVLLRIVLMGVLCILGVWLLGKFILFILKKTRKSP